MLFINGAIYNSAKSKKCSNSDRNNVHCIYMCLSYVHVYFPD